MREKLHEVDFCVVGGGMSGLCAAVAAARRGARVALMQDRPVLGGNASSEIRMWICGAHGDNNRETGIVEEVQLENNYRNPSSNASIWDSVLYEAARFQPNLTLLLNCSCVAASMDGARIASIRGWQGTAETWHTVRAGLFADCSGDSVLAPLTGAEFRRGREARAEFGEDIAPEQADERTMGMSCLFQARETASPKPFIPPTWAKVFASDAELPNRGHGFTGLSNFWWLELGGEGDAIHDTEDLRDELLAIAFGVWDHIKNRGEHGAANWELEWVGFLPGKRESRRYVGDHILTQNDIRSEGRFDDLVAYGGWSMDDHHPGGLRYPGKPTIFHPAPSPYGIPYRCLYSRNIENLFVAGRNISCTHAAMSSTRVMATCALCGQAAGTAASLATRYHTTPRGVYENHLRELQQALLDDDCFLPWQRRDIGEMARQAELTASAGDAEPLRNGVDRPVGAAENAWSGRPGTDWVQYRFERPRRIGSVRIVFDSNLNRLGQGACANHVEKNILSNYPLGQPPRTVPDTLTRAFTLEALDAAGRWSTVARIDDNHQRLVRVPLQVEAVALRLTPLATWGAPMARLFAFEPREA
ncbi:MAG: FAD-dependent oxidoreductase [Lentisphaerae bacterium]|nr:FAD-dependent oxidoreductase [Lentisphaerota bacterium]